MELLTILSLANSPVVCGVGFLIWRTNRMEEKLTDHEKKLNSVAEDVAYVKGRQK